MIEQLSLAAVGRELPSYVSWLSGPAADGDDGPEEFVVIVLDNGRSRIRESDEREILNCIRCGSCLTVCPVYSKVGGHAYGSVYGGPDRRGADAAPDRHAARRRGASCRSSRRSAARAPTPARSASRCTTCSCATARSPTAPARPRAASAPPGAPGRAPGRARASTAPRRAPARAPGPFARAFGPGASWLDGRATLPLPSTKPFHRRWRDLDDGA